jgi:EcsC protein family
MARGTEMEPVERVPERLWRRILAQPERSPELIALAAAERFAAPAKRWVEIAGVGHGSGSLAGMAYRKHVRLSRVEGLALGLGGIVTGAANLAGLAWIQARMVFYIAAAHGFDPAHPMRPAELLALWDVYETPAAAREALDGMGTPMAQALVQSRLGRSGEQKLRDRLIRYVGKRVAKRAVGRFVPLLGAPISAVQNGDSTAELGRRALAYYGGNATRRGARGNRSDSLV